MSTKNSLKLYVWEDVLCDWTSGMIVVVARSDKEAIQRLQEEFNGSYSKNEGLTYQGVNPEIVELDGLESSKIWIVYGGG